MQNLTINLKSAEVKNAMEITGILYQAVEEKKIPSIKINQIKRGRNSIDVNSIIPLLQSIDLDTLFKAGIIFPPAYAPSVYYGLKIVDKCIDVATKVFDLAEKRKKRSSLGLQCKIGSQRIVKLGSSYGVTYFDTILTSATQETVQNTLIAKKRWGEIPIAKEKYLMIKHVAIFVKHPVRALEWIGKVKNIKYNPTSKKSTIFLDGKPKRIKSIPYDKNCQQHNGHGTVYTTMKRIKSAKTLCDVYPSLNP